jgi:hypothetical protein
MRPSPPIQITADGLGKAFDKHRRLIEIGKTLHDLSRHLRDPALSERRT